MTEKPSLKPILDVYYALLAQGVQRFPRPLLPSQPELRARKHCLFFIDFATDPIPLEVRSGETFRAPPIIARLLDKLPWREQVTTHLLFEAVPKSPQLHPIDEDLISRVKDLIAQNEPDRCVCFGWRAAQVCAVALGVPFSFPPEAYEPLECTFDENKSVEILVFPDVREIEALPEWRSKVWESLLAFGPVR